ncbi:hypothetical protein FACS1894217_04980 [Clostridia bacterium]|nr:hypothetical protein FACS1894217_04980 [Clostridia bacterium]
MIYVCSPYRGDIKRNIEFAKAACQFVRNYGLKPFAPHLVFTKYLDDNDPKQRRIGIALGILIMRMCSEVWVFGSVISSGMQAEILNARKTRKVVRFWKPT